MAAATRAKKRSLLAIEAWREYLQRTSGLSLTRYEQVEPWAWRMLTERMASGGEPIVVAKGEEDDA